MTYREAIAIVARLSDVERVAAQQDRNRVLAKVAHWPEDVPDIWRDLVAAIGVTDWEPAETTIDVPARGVTMRRDALRQLWTTKPWTIGELSRATGISETSLRAYKRTVFRGCAWRTETRGKFQRAYQIADRP